MRHHQGTVFLGLGHTLHLYRFTIENYNDLFKKKYDGEERRSHLMANCRGEGFGLRFTLLIFLVIQVKNFLFNLFRLVTNVKGYRRLTYIILLFEFDRKEFVINVDDFAT